MLNHVGECQLNGRCNTYQSVHISTVSPRYTLFTSPAKVWMFSLTISRHVHYEMDESVDTFGYTVLFAIRNRMTGLCLRRKPMADLTASCASGFFDCVIRYAYSAACLPLLDF